MSRSGVDALGTSADSLPREKSRCSQFRFPSGRSEENKVSRGREGTCVRRSPHPQTQNFVLGPLSLCLVRGDVARTYKTEYGTLCPFPRPESQSRHLKTKVRFLTIKGG